MSRACLDYMHLPDLLNVYTIYRNDAVLSTSFSEIFYFCEFAMQGVAFLKFASDFLACGWFIGYNESSRFGAGWALRNVLERGNNMRKPNLFHKSLAVLLAASMAFTGLSAEGLTLHAKAQSGITINASAVYAEGAYVTWAPVLDANQKAADGYEVYVSQNQADAESWVRVDDELIRNYGDYLRADILGLTPGTWYVKIVAGTYNSAKEMLSELATQVETVTVTGQDRSGFAWKGGTASGAYQENGTLKSDATVIYVTEDTKNKVSVTLDDGTTTAVGIQNIFTAYSQGKATKPLDVRVIGRITDPATLVSGDLKFGNIKNGDASVTIEGVGEDAVISGFGLVLEDSANVEIRNLAFMLCDSQEGDSVSLVNNNEHIWVHNCDLFYGMPGGDEDQKKGDGAMDSKKSNYVTFSYNHFWDCGKSCLLGLEENETDKYCITYHHNWFDHSDSRHPRVRYYSAHVYNNYFDGNAKYGIGATCGSSIFAENNYFRNCAYPMKISMQGSDNGTFSGEPGGIIKAYGNYMTGQTGFINGNPNVIGSSDGNDKDATSVHATLFDAYVVSTREEQIPDSIVTKVFEKDGATVGGTAYNNFDTAADFYSYTLTKTMDVPTVVQQSAGRLNGGDFRWTFDNDKDDASSDVNEELKSALLAYESKLVSVGGFLSASTKIYRTVTLDPNNGDATTSMQAELNQPLSNVADPTKIPEGYVEFGYWTKDGVQWDMTDPVTGDMTLVAKYLTQAEADANKRGGTPVGTTTVKHSILEYGLGSRYFEIVGDLKQESSYSSGVYASGTADEWKVGNGRNGRLTFNTTASISFTTTTETSLLVVLMDKNNSSAILVDGISVSPADGVVLATVEAGEHRLTNRSSCYVTGIMVVPGAKEPEEEPAPAEDPDNFALNVGEDLDAGDYTENYTKNGFTLVATSSGKLTVDGNNKSVDGVSYSKRLKTGGGGSTTERSVMFTTKGAAQLYLAAMASSSGATRLVSVVSVDDAAQTTVDSFEMGGSALASKTVEIKSAGTYYIWADGGLNIYAIKVTYPAPAAGCVVKFETNGAAAIADVTVPSGDTLAEPAAPMRENYQFDGWYKDAEYKERYDFATAVTEGFILYAKWNRLYTVSFETNGGTAVDSVQVAEGGTCTAPAAPAKAGQLFNGWYTDAACTIAYDFATPVTADLKLYAGWLERGLYVLFADTLSKEAEYTYTGSAIKPQILVTNNGESLQEGVDYTVKYTNNVNASEDSSKKPTVTVTGKGNLAGSAVLTFTIRKKNVADEDVIKGDIVAASVEKAEAVLSYNGMILKKNKDFMAAATEIMGAREMLITGIGKNYTGAVTVPITVVKDASKLGKLAVKITVDKNQMVYDGTPKTVEVTVTDAKSKAPLTLDTQYEVFYTNNINAGTAKVTVVGKGDYTGAVTKTFAIKPAKTDASVKNINSAAAKGYAFVGTGVTIDADLAVYAANGTLLEQGKDYKITYSGNKKVSTDKSKAKYTVTLLGNYKGSKAVKGDFSIVAANLEQLYAAGAVQIAVPDKTAAKAGVYKSTPSISVNGVILKNSDMTVTYHTDSARTTVMDKAHPAAVAADTSAQVYVKVEGKGNYTGTLAVQELSYRVSTVDKTLDLGKAKVTVTGDAGKGKATYTGEALTPAVTVTIGSGKNAVTLKEHQHYEVSYTGNIYKGKGTVVINAVAGNAEGYAGGKTASFSIISKSLKDLLTK